jgi:hypothetical protein
MKNGYRVNAICQWRRTNNNKASSLSHPEEKRKFGWVGYAFKELKNNELGVWISDFTEKVLLNH